jgi:dienelactone hydrolase
MIFKSLFVVAAVALLATAPAQAKPPARFVAAELPPTLAGEQAAWVIDASGRPPIAAAELREHFRDSFLAQPSSTPAAINRVLGQVGALKLVGVVASDSRGLIAVVRGTPQEFTLTVVAGADGKIDFSTLEGSPRSTVTLPRPSGSLPVGTDVLQLRDAARKRTLMLTRWYPAARATGPLAPYAGPRLRDALALPRVRTHARRRAPAHKGALPVVLFSPGGGTSRVRYTALAEDLASHGYLVVSVDHTGEAPVELADGSLQPPAWGEPVPHDPIHAAAARRLADMRFVLRRLPHLPRGPRPDLARIAAVGHSLGGSTAAELVRTGRLVRAGVDLDGTLFGPAAQQGVPRPFLVLTAHGLDASIRNLARHSDGRVLAFNVAGFVHMSFSDLPAIYPGFAGLGRNSSPRDVVLQAALVRAFLDRELRGLPAPLLDAPGRRFPQVTRALGGAHA